MPDKLVLLMYESWAQLDRAVEGLTPGEATARSGADSSIAWTVAHVTNMVDSWLNVRFQGLRPHRLISDPDFRTGGSGGAGDWPAISAGVAEVRRASRQLLDSVPEPDLDRVVPYDGSIAFLRPMGLRLSYAVMRIAAHHFMHAGEILSVRSRMGHSFPETGDWGRALA